MINSIIFDLGGVLITNDDEGLISNSRELQKLLNTDQNELQKAWDISAREFFKGEISEEIFFENFLRHFHLSDKKLRNKLKEIYRKNVKVLPSFGIAKALVDKYNLFALTNMPKEWLAYKVDKFHLVDLFQLIIASCNVGTGKPAKEIYEYLILESGIIPRNALYIDDSEDNIAMGKKVGFDTIFFENKEGLLKEINARGVGI